MIHILHHHVKLLSLLLVGPSCAASAHVTAAVAVASLACDGGQTIQFRAHGWSEANPILGETPDPQDVVGYMVGAAVLLAAANTALPAWASTALNVGVLALEANSIRYNEKWVGASLCGLGRFGGVEGTYR